MKLFTFTTITGVIIIASLIIHSCKKENTPTSNMSEDILSTTIPYIGCESQCLEPGSGDYYFKDAHQTIQWGNDNKFTKTVDLRVYNTETEFVYMFKSTHSPQNLYIDGDSILSTTQGSEYSWITYKTPLPQGWLACDLIEHVLKIDGQGPEIIFNISYSLIGLCQSCVESFTFTDNGDSTYTFTYIPIEDTNNAFIEFTFPQSVVISTPQGWDQTGNGHVRQTHADLTACKPYVFTFGLIHTPNGQGPLWTDFKINGISRN